MYILHTFHEATFTTLSKLCIFPQPTYSTWRNQHRRETMDAKKLEIYIPWTTMWCIVQLHNFLEHVLFFLVEDGEE